VPPSLALAGHLFILSLDVLCRAARAEMARTASEVSFLLFAHWALKDREQRQLEIDFDRHALLGPLQGLFSAAGLLGARAQEGQRDMRTAELLKSIRRERAAIRIWLNRRRFIGRAVEDVPLRKRRTVLYKIVERIAGDAFREEANLEVFLQGGADARHAAVETDDQAIGLVVWELLNNAQKYSTRGSIVTVAMTATPEVVELSVANSSPFGQELTGRAFEAGWRGSDTMHVPGSGMGLFVVGRLVEALGGHISASSVPMAPKGETDRAEFRVRFALRLPRVA
jgi:signal transduction histidine kinase